VATTVYPTTAIVTPSRGLLHSRTVESVMAIVAELGGSFCGWHLTHDKPAPEAQNIAFEAAYATGADYILSIEEDNLLPPGALDALFAVIAAGHDIAFLDYPVGWPTTYHCVYVDDAGTAMWCGLGSTLISRKVFDANARPWFHTENQVEYVRFGGSEMRRKVVTDKPYTYGGFDLHFMNDARTNGFTIGVVPSMTGTHAWLANWGTKDTNAGGPHTVIVRETFDRWPGRG
jgi:hypothetical protein